ncbi:putative Late nodulin [Medicago truncatula]|uniref:Late nodulin n=1 Tax=Medicago truncatula TaxID=3880 RepID=A0A072TVM6_MEDTR|nr:late nodulin [Medicago truncatula]RHN44029.1 putative Late nodulin [Medicago truncatula]
MASILNFVYFMIFVHFLFLVLTEANTTNCTSIADCASKICALPSVVWCLSHSNTCICL